MEEVLLYSTHCPKCKVLAQKLDQKGIAYKLKATPDDLEEIIEKGYKSVPVLVVGDNYMDFMKAVEWINLQ